MQHSTNERPIYRPEPAVNGHCHKPPVPMKVYRSSIGDALTIAFDVDGTGLFRDGLRLTPEQVTALRDQLDRYLADVS